MMDCFSPPDTISKAELVSLIINYEFLPLIYHADGAGHVQVEIPHHTNPYNINCLLERLDHRQHWSELISCLSKKKSAWLLSFSDELQKETSVGALNCLVKLTDFLASSDEQITHLQYTHKWHWHLGSVALLLRVKNSLNEIECRLLKEPGLSAEIDLSIVRHSLAGLQAIQKKIEGKS